MMRIFTVLAGAILLSAVSSTVPQPAGGAGSPGGPGGAVPDKALMQRINDAWTTLDPANAAPYYDQDGARVFFDVAPLKYTGWSAYAKGATELFKTLRSMRYTVGDDAVIHVSGDIAWGTATLHLVTVDQAGQRQEVDLRWTPIWQKKGGRWLIVHEHLSAPVSSQAP